MNINPILILVSIWSGVIIFFSAVVAPTVFKSLGEKEAGMFLRGVFSKVLYLWWSYRYNFYSLFTNHTLFLGFC